MTALTDRITEVLEAHRPYGLDCKCGEAINSDKWWAAHVAERIEAELNFADERHWFRTVGGVDGQWQHAVVGWVPLKEREDR